MSSPLSEIFTPSSNTQVGSRKSRGIGAGQGAGDDFRQSFNAEVQKRHDAGKAQQGADARRPHAAKESAAEDRVATNADGKAPGFTKAAVAETAPESSTQGKTERNEQVLELEGVEVIAEGILAAPVQPTHSESGVLAGNAGLASSQAVAAPPSHLRPPVEGMLGAVEGGEQGQFFGNGSFMLGAQPRIAEVTFGSKLSQTQLAVQSSSSQAGALQTSLNVTGGLNKLLKLDGLPLNRLEAGAFAALGSMADGVQANPTASPLSGALNGTSLVDMAAPRMQIPINISFGQPQWANMVAERSAMLFSQNIHNAELILDPPELGRMNVQIQVHNNEQASVTFTSANPGVREALDQSSQRLRDLLSEQGLDLVNVDVSDERSSRDHEQPDAESGARSDLAAGGEESHENTESSPLSVAVNLGVDHYV